MFHYEKGGEPRENVTIIPKKSGWELASWRVKGRENVYKRGEGYHKEGVEKYQEKDLEKGVWERVRLYFSFTFFPCWFPVHRERNPCITNLLICNPTFLISCLSFPLWNFHPFLVMNKLCESITQESYCFDQIVFFIVFPTLTNNILDKLIRAEKYLHCPYLSSYMNIVLHIINSLNNLKTYYIS